MKFLLPKAGVIFCISDFSIFPLTCSVLLFDWIVLISLVVVVVVVITAAVFAFGLFKWPSVFLPFNISLSGCCLLDVAVAAAIIAAVFWYDGSLSLVVILELVFLLFNKSSLWICGGVVVGDGGVDDGVLVLEDSNLGDCSVCELGLDVVGLAKFFVFQRHEAQG